LREQIAQLQQELDNLRNDQAARSNDAAAFKQREQELLDRISQLEGQLKVHIHNQSHRLNKKFF
jgi:chromosome segregation ATPase